MMYVDDTQNSETEKIRKECGISDDRVIVRTNIKDLEYYNKETGKICKFDNITINNIPVYLSFFNRLEKAQKGFPRLLQCPINPAINPYNMGKKGYTKRVEEYEFEKEKWKKDVASRRYYVICDNTCHEIFIKDGFYIEIGNNWDAEDEIIAQNMGFEPSICWKIYVRNLIKLFFHKMENYKPGDIDEIEEILIKLGDEFDQSYTKQNIVKLAVESGCDIDVIDMLLEYGFPLPLEQIHEFPYMYRRGENGQIYHGGKEISKDRFARVKESQEYVNRLIREGERAIEANKRLRKMINELSHRGRKFDKLAFEKYISDGASLSYKDELGNNSLHYATRVAHSKSCLNDDDEYEEGKKAVKAIIDITGSDLVYEKNNAGYTPLDLVNALDRRGEIKKLLVNAHSKKQGDIKKILESRVMRNPVELLTIVNPEKPAWPKDRVAWLIGAGLVTSIAHGIYKNRVRQASTGEEARRISWYYWGFMGAAVVGAYILYGDKIREMSPSRNPRIRRGDVEWVESVKNGRPIWFAYVGDEFIGEIGTYKSEDGFRYRLADEWVWSPSDSFEEAVDGLIDDCYLSEIEELWDIEEDNQERYFVILPEDGVYYPKKGSKYYPDGYPLTKALKFARIGSQRGGPREVRRGSRNGLAIRVYGKGKRAWPLTRAQAKRLLPVEVPERLRSR